MKLSDSAIAQVVKLLQMALITGTDISDNLRMMELVDVDGKLEVDEEYLKVFEDNLQKLVDEADAQSAGKAEDRKPRGFN